jgi:hypothetical protein
VDECLDTLAGNVWYSKLDANSTYWQVKIKPEDCSKTAFITKYGLFELARMCHLSVFFDKSPMIVGEPQKPLHLLFILRPRPVLYVFDIPWQICGGRIDSDTGGSREGSSVQESCVDSGATKILQHSKGIISNY